MSIESIVASIGTNMTLEAGSPLFKKGDPGDTMFFIKSGAVEIKNNDQLLETCREGEMCGYMSVIDDKPRSADAIVSEKVEVTVVQNKKFWFMMDEVPNFNKYILSTMAKRIRGMAKVVSSGG